MGDGIGALFVGRLFRKSAIASTAALLIFGAVGTTAASADADVAPTKAIAALSGVPGLLASGKSETGGSTGTHLPARASEGVGFAGLTLALPGASSSRPAVDVAPGAVVYPSSNGYSTAVQTIAGASERSW